MKMTGLETLHRSMKTINAEMQQFQVAMGAISFDCLFSTRDKPCYTLALTSRGLDPQFFIFEVKPGYFIVPFFDDFYDRLKALLNTEQNTGRKLMPKEFLENLNVQIPSNALLQSTPTPSSIIRLRPDITEDREKPHFNTWMYWSPDSKKGPTPENLKKTRLSIGMAAYEYSKRMNASAKWSAVDLQRNWQDMAR